MDPILRRSLTVGLLNCATIWGLALTDLISMDTFTFPLFALIVLTGVFWSLTLRMIFGRPVPVEDDDDVST